MEDGPPAKKVRLEADGAVDITSLRARRSAFLNSLTRSISPPRNPSTDKRTATQQSNQQLLAATTKTSQSPLSTKSIQGDPQDADPKQPPTSSIQRTGSIIPSPIQLTRIRDLPSSKNVDTVSLHDILGDPLIKEVWIFNYCFDVDWLMQYLDVDVKDTVQVKIVHGFWKREDPRKEAIDNACNPRSNVTAVQAYLPDTFGTHHSKMFVLLRHDDSAQVVIHTANMLAQDWTNMTQAVWKSPLLPLLNGTSSQEDKSALDHGHHFKRQLLRYLGVYGNKLKPLVQQLRSYDFGQVRATLIASVPSRFNISAADDQVWGYEQLRRELKKVTLGLRKPRPSPHFVFQVSSIASLPKEWMKATLYSACGSTKSSTSIVFPTAADVRESLDGYNSGGSIHTKAQSATHLKQISAMQSQLCRWTAGPSEKSRSGRALAAPHIKTYIRYASMPSEDDPVPDIDWALVTSANLSTQAWGSAPKLAKGEVDPAQATIYIQSYEIGVLLWPELYDRKPPHNTSLDEGNIIRMVPTFMKDKLDHADIGNDEMISFRMPYDLPLTPYEPDELPWSPNSAHNIPDRHGQRWL